jgi:hypothetical protein
MALLDDVKVACRVTSNTFDSELNMLIDSAKIDLGIAGVVLPSELDSICNVAIITYCKMKFGNPDNYDSLKASYDEQKAQLSTHSGYTNWMVNRNG